MVDEQQQPQEEEVHYFSLDTIGLRVTGTLGGGLGQRPQVVDSLLQDWANKSQFVRRQKMVLSDPRVLDFPATPEVLPVAGQPYARAIQASQPFSLIFAKVTDLANLRSDGLVDPLALLKLVSGLNTQRHLARKKVEGVDIQRVVLDWRCGPSSEPGSTGGPGGKPIPTKSPKIAKKDTYKIRTGKLSKRIRDLVDKENVEEKDLVVAILDTAPRKDLDSIYEQWVTKRLKPHLDPEDPHTLIQSFLGPTRNITIHRNHELSLAPAKDWKLLGHDYLMSSHGLAVMSIIGSRIPGAEFHLFQVLNDYGVGDLESFARALQMILHLFKDRLCLINCSLVFTLPFETAHTKVGILNDFIGREILDNIEEYKAQAELIGSLCDLVNAHGMLMIAAAGNDYDPEKHGDQRPGARCPAAFDSVIGVGASPRIAKRPTESEPLQAASYSNLADKPSGTGIVTFGGDKENGVLTIFIEDEFPPEDPTPSNPNPAPKPNENGWCRWYGTSFAAPFVTGVTAAVLRGLLIESQSTTTQDAISTLSTSFHKNASVDNEDILSVTQT